MYPQVNFIVFIGKRPALMTSEVGKNTGLTSPDLVSFIFFNWFYIHLLFAHHVATLPQTNIDPEKW